jgi:hypothetical protein
MLGKALLSKSDPNCITSFENALYSSDPKKYESAIELGTIYYEGKIVEKNLGEAAEYFWQAYTEGKLEEGKKLFEQYQLKDVLIEYLNKLKTEGNRSEDYVNKMLNSLNK